MKLTDESEMLFGKYKGDKMKNVPCDYLMRIYNANEQSDPNNATTEAVLDYIEDNLEDIEKTASIKGNL